MSNTRKTENILSVVHAEEAAEEEQVEEEPQDSKPIIEEGWSSIALRYPTFIY